jgi:hypothetical protein
MADQQKHLEAIDRVVAWRRRPSRGTYSSNPLTLEVAYHFQLGEPRARLHARVAGAQDAARRPVRRVRLADSYAARHLDASYLSDFCHATPVFSGRKRSTFSSAAFQ